MARGDLNASQKGSSQRGASVSDREVELVVMRVLTTKLGLSERNVQDLQTLAGLRTDPGDTGKPKAAVRRADLAAIGKVPELSSKEASGAVTVENFNALRRDMRRIFEALSIIAQAVK